MSELIAEADWKPVGVDGLEPNAEWAVRSRSNAVVIAGPGAGKTELLAQRACFLLQTGICKAPHRILAISFKRDAARNLAERVKLRAGATLASRFDSYTFDAFAKGIVDRFRGGLPDDFRPSANLRPDFEFERQDPLRTLFESCAGEESGYTFDELQRVSAEKFYEQRICGVPLDTNPATSGGEAKPLTRVFWKRALKSGTPTSLSFRMINRLGEAVLRINPKVLAALRETYRFAFFDEFQDTTSLQYDLMVTMFKECGTVITPVGDPKQRIMSWAGALDGIFARFAQDFTATAKHLIMNWRSSPRLVEIQHRLIAALDSSAPSPEWPKSKASDPGECRILSYRDDDQEASDLAERIASWINSEKIPPREICILTRNRPDAYTELLRTQLEKVGVSSRVENDFQDLLSEPLVEFVVHFLTLACSRKSPDSWDFVEGLVLSVAGLSAEDSGAAPRVDQLTSFLNAARNQLSGIGAEETSIAALVDSLLDLVGRPAFRLAYPQYSHGNHFEEVLKKCVASLAHFRGLHADWPTVLSAFLGADCVPIMTIHKSKGLEYHTVVFVGLEDSAFWGFSKNPTEESCGFFVAFSRAKCRVIFTFAGMRQDTRYRRMNAQRHATIAAFYNLLEEAGVLIEEV